VSRRSDDIVREIRARRPHVKAAVRALLSVDELSRRIRNSPGRWLAGGALAGLLAGRFFALPLAREGRRRVAGAAISRLRPLVLGLVTAVATSVRDRARDRSHDGEGSSGPPVVERSHGRSVR